MLNVAVTGNVAAGKSTVVRWFEEWGAEVIDADELVREVQRRDSPTLHAIVQRFGPEILAPDGSLDRPALRQRVLDDADALDALNAIVHPAVRLRRDERAASAAARGVAVLINDIPLLFEVLDPSEFDLVVLVDAPVATRRARLVALRGLTPDEADRLMAAQLPAAQKRAPSHLVIDNDGTLDELRAKAWSAWEVITAHASQYRRPSDARGRS